MTELIAHPLTDKRWSDFEALFGERGACGGCWCMWYRLKRSAFEAQKGKGNRQAMRDLVEAKQQPGILCYQGSRAVGWCAVGPREQFSVLQRSRILKPVDSLPVWSITCFFIAKAMQRQGMSKKLLASALEFATNHGANIVEGYPIDPKTENYPVVFASTGFYRTFVQSGFVECARRSATRPIMRYAINRQTEPMERS